MTRRDEVMSSLKEKQAREIFIEIEAQEGLGFQIRQIRESKNWSQGELAKRAGISRPTVIHYEDCNYSKHTLKVLIKIANAFDVGLLVRLCSFDDLLDWAVFPSNKKLVPDSFIETQK